MTSPLPRMSGLLVAAIATGALGAALYFQHVLGYQPCQLCLWQRWAYYAGVPLALVAAMTGSRTLLWLVALVFAANAVFGVYHAGIEWDFWAGPSSCGAGTATVGGGNLLEDLKNTRIVPCDEATWRMFGLSFAGWSAVVCTACAAVAAFGTRR